MIFWLVVVAIIIVFIALSYYGDPLSVLTKWDVEKERERKHGKKCS